MIEGFEAMVDSHGCTTLRAEFLLKTSLLILHLLEATTA